MILACLSLMCALILASPQPVRNYTETPIIAIGLPKSGSTSLNKYLNSCTRQHYSVPAGRRIQSIHFTYPRCNHRMIYPLPAVKVENNITWPPVASPELVDRHFARTCTIAARIQRAMADNLPPLFYVLGNRVNSVVQMDSDLSTMAVFPQIDALTAILDAYPNALYIHHIRNVSRHVQSIMNWHDMAKRWQQKGLLSRFRGHEQSGHQTIEMKVRMFVETARMIIRAAFATRRNYQYLEIDIEHDPGESKIQLAKFVGVRNCSNDNVPHANAGVYKRIKFV